MLLSHDVDQIHDRELFRVLADVNHIRRMVFNGETGSIPRAARRVARALVWPKPALRDFETLLAIEGRHGFRSSFYILHDPYWSRHGPRYTLRSPAIHRIVRRIGEAGGEIGVHGGYYRFNDAAAYRESREAVQTAFGLEVSGIRNHHLRYCYPDTWRAQAEAGFSYDSTYGWPEELGPRSGLPFPFFAYDAPNQRVLDLVELPLTVMDATLFRYLRLTGEQALEAAWKTVQEVVGIGGLVTLLWHNNYFNEPEYWDWQMVYEKLLDRLAPLKPWCATGVEINRWWRTRAAIQWENAGSGPEGWRWRLEVPQEIRNLAVRVRPAEAIRQVTVHEGEGIIERREDGWYVRFGLLQAGTCVSIRADRESQRRRSNETQKN